MSAQLVRQATFLPRPAFGLHGIFIPNRPPGQARTGIMSAKDFKKGDDVTWKTSNGETEGHVVKTVTKPMKIKSNEVKASKDNPKIVVESDKTGAKAAHKPDTLHKK